MSDPEHREDAEAKKKRRHGAQRNYQFVITPRNRVERDNEQRQCERESRINEGFQPCRIPAPVVEVPGFLKPFQRILG